MKRHFVTAILTAALGLLSACSTTTAAHRLGSVKTVSDHTLQLCFDPQAVPPVAGQQVQLVRRQQFGNPKFPPTFRERPVGTAQIDADVTGRCAAATLVEGNARRFDEAHPALADRKPH
ncbi:hypothetical protein JY409_08230 [Stenotrophomonas maltophilia]|jgi:hypothetical protein|nr:hypothetical protein [Stenotrophomonas maltophilia]